MSEVWNEYLSIMTDPAHVLAELSFICIEVFIIYVLVAFIRKGIIRHFHRDLRAGQHKENNNA